MRSMVIALAALAVAGIARAEVLDSGPGGFTTRSSLVIRAPAAKVWADLIRPAAWWSSEHTYFGDARNLTLDARVGGAWDETLADGRGGRHLVVVRIEPPRTLRLEGALGPLQAFGVAAHLTFTLAAQGEDTLVTATYDVGGHAPGGLDRFSAPVDRVLGEQIGRLKAFAEGDRTP